jgi:hypothetical protein
MSGSLDTGMSEWIGVMVAATGIPEAILFGDPPSRGVAMAAVSAAPEQFDRVMHRFRVRSLLRLRLHRTFRMHWRTEHGSIDWRALSMVDGAVDPLAMEALWVAHGKGAGPRRNAAMRDVLVTLRDGGAVVTCLAMPYGEARGTRGMMALLRDAGFAVDEIGGG